MFKVNNKDIRTTIWNESICKYLSILGYIKKAENRQKWQLQPMNTQADTQTLTLRRQMPAGMNTDR